MIETDVQLDDKAMRKYMRSLMTLFPREMARAVAMSAGIVKRQITSAIKKNGNEVTGSFDAMSPIRNFLRSDKPGGVLSQAKSIKIYRTGKTSRYIDFVPGLRGYAARWQTGGAVGFDSPAVRKMMHSRLARAGVSNVVLDRNASQPDRPVTQPIFDYAGKKMHRWILGSLNKILDGKAGKFKFPKR